MQDWNGREIGCAQSKGGVIVTAHPFDNLIRTGCSPWPPPEIVQKLYQSRQIRAFTGEDRKICRSGLGFYCDLQSIHSEDAITWSVFGTAARASRPDLENWLRELFRPLHLPDCQTDDAEISLWRRIPHPESLVPGGPEIDAGITTSNAVILIEAKWRSRVGAAQGKMRDKDQIQLRGEFLKKFGSRLLPNCSEFAVVGISLFGNAFKDTTPQGIEFRSTTWEEVCSLTSHPYSEELWRYFEWKRGHTRMVDEGVRGKR